VVRITWTREAEVWLHDIFKYISRDKPETALSLIQSIYDRVQILHEFPETGYRYWDITNRHVRILLYGHYRIAYLIKSDGTIDILGVFHGALEIEKYLM